RKRSNNKAGGKKMSIMREKIKCDAFSFEAVKSDKIRFLRIYDKSFNYKKSGSYEGYFGVEIDRINLVRILIDLQSDGLRCFSVPLCYKENRLLNESECLLFAKKYASSIGVKISEERGLVSLDLPLYHTFTIIDGCQERAGGIVRIDKLDGHVWTLLEFEEYMYDFNGLLI
ncbi:hypothetical protein, partial [Xanthomonas graminis]